jgi:endonuclease/exonuclease/phosphatase family metal-dependent hydrolase
MSRTWHALLWLGLGTGGLAALSLALVCTRRPPPATRPERSGLPVKVITFNVQLLPGPGRLFNKRPDPKYRARELGRRLADYDLIALNEVFDPGPRELLLKELQQRLGDRYHHVLPPASERSMFGIDSGLVLVSRLPVLSSHSLRYGNDSSVWKHGPLADGFSAKGALHARLASGPGGTSDESFDVFVTHLESYDRAAREAQYTLLAEFLRRHSNAGRPALLLGDFNTDGRPGFMKDPASPYRRMVAALQRERPGCRWTDLWPLFSPDPGGTSDPDTEDGGERLDYIFVSNPAEGKVLLRPCAVRLNRFSDPRVTTLSDHVAVEADLQYVPGGREPEQ